MTTVVCLSPDEVAETVADMIGATVRSTRRPIIGLATGSTVEPIYQALIEQHKQGLSFADTTAYLLDEYVGLDVGHPASYNRTIRTTFVDHVDLPDDAVHGPSGSSEDLESEAHRYDRAIKSATIDLQLVGIGRNGHLAFNEPGASLASTTRVVDLSQTTRQDNSRFFPSTDDVPTKALTQGIATIMRAKRIVLAASGTAKKTAVAAAIEGPITCAIPTSALQLHPDVTYIVDKAAATNLTFSVRSS